MGTCSMSFKTITYNVQHQSDDAGETLKDKVNICPIYYFKNDVRELDY